MNSIRRILVAAVLVWPALAVHASGGGGTDEIVSVPRGQPEPTAVAGYLHGHLGVLWPGYDRAFLMMAYRQSMGHVALTEAGAAAWTNPQSDGALGEYWLAARRAAAAPDQPDSTQAGARATGQFSYAGNCQPDAFRVAAATLRARAKAHADQPAAIANWIAGQDAVFAACDHADATPPPAAPANAPAWLRHDRAYQAAASLLYLGHDDRADEAFSAIAADTGSPWKEWASYLQARVWWRDTFKQPADYKNFAAQVKDWRLEPMPSRLVALAADARDPDVREAAAELLRTVQARIEPADVHRALWRRIDAADPPADFAAWIADERFLWVLMKDEDVVDDWLFQTRSINMTNPVNQQAADLSTAWTKHPTHAWLASALMAAHPGTPGLESVLTASRTLKPENPLYLHDAWQRARLALEARDFPGARRELAAARQHLDGEAIGTRQAFDQLEMLAASSLSAVGEHLQRLPLAREEDNDGAFSELALPGNAPQAPFMDIETRLWLASNLDGTEMLELARNAKLTKAVREDLAGAAWIRGALLAQQDLEAGAQKLFVSLGDVADVAAAATLDEQRFRMARHLLLNELANTSPETQVDGLTEVWWRTAPAFHDQDKVAHVEQMRKDFVAANQTTWLGQAMLPWLRVHRSAEGPALLEKLVYSSRYGPNDTKTSRAAFQLLHQQYPNSPEAQRTRYFY
jgi:hypothetical protein